MKKGIAPPGAYRGGVKTRKGDRLIVVDASTEDGELSTAHFTALYMYLYAKEGDYHNAMNGDVFKDWIENYFIPTWRDKYGTLPCILVLDNAPYHVTDLVNPYTMTKRECLDTLRRVLGSNALFEFERGDEIFECEVPEQGGNVANAPAGPSKEEVQNATYEALYEHSPSDLQTWLEWRFEQLGWSVIFTPPYAASFQCQELVWANAKNDVARKYFKGRDWEWIQNRLTSHLKQIDCASLVRHAESCMTAWIENDRVLNGTIDDLVVADDVREDLLRHNAKFLSETELNDYLHDDDIDVHIEIDDASDSVF